MLVDDELVGISSTVMSNGNSFAAPNEFCTAGAKPLPTPKGQIRGTAIGGGVPSFHWLRSDAISDFLIADMNWLG
jgi:hypothetical protein